MLSPEHLAIVKSTAPVLAEHGLAITTRFYKDLFDAHPELQNVFNMANQRNGDQARALATSVFNYASHIDQLTALGPMVNRIAHKHASLQVAPEHYPIVGQFLLKAIREHLSLAEDDPILGAWAEAYGALAKIFIDTEEGIYQGNQEKAGGWRGFREFTIQTIVLEAQDIRSYYLVPKDTASITDFEPGQYIGVKVRPEEDGYDEIRQYSLSDAPGLPYYRITVKAESRTQEGAESPTPGVVSNYLYRAQLGDSLYLQPPTGDFVQKQRQGPAVFIAGGVGVTPLLSMIYDRIRSGSDMSDVVFIHCCRDACHHVHGPALRALSKEFGFQYHACYEKGAGSDHEGLIDSALLNQWIPNKQTPVYFCGPKTFMSKVNESLRNIGVAEELLNYEVFGPSLAFEVSRAA